MSTGSSAPKGRNHYRRGADFERATRTDLRSHGYHVIRSAGSKTKVDLMAIKPGELLLIQCKLPHSALPASEWNTLRQLARFCDARPVIALKFPGVARPLYRELWTDAPRGRRRDLGTHWNVWHPDPLGEAA